MTNYIMVTVGMCILKLSHFCGFSKGEFVMFTVLYTSRRCQPLYMVSFRERSVL